MGRVTYEGMASVWPTSTDEYRLVTRPAALGSGEPMFKDLGTVLHLDLIESNAYPDGTVITVYRPLRRLT